MPQPHTPYLPQSTPYPTQSSSMPLPNSFEQPGSCYSPQQPYSSTQQLRSYPSFQPAYPSTTLSYPNHPSAAVNHPNPSSTSHNAGLYPNISNVNSQLNPLYPMSVCGNNMHTQQINNSTPYPGGGYSGGRGTNYDNPGNNGSSHPYGALAPRISQTRPKVRLSS